MHNVKITVEIATDVTLLLPEAATRIGIAPVCAAIPISASSWPKGARVLVVDDEASVLQTLGWFLRKAGYEAVLAVNGEDALALIERGDPFDLIVTDQSMPGISGTDLIGKIAQLRPTLSAILITGYDRVGGLDKLNGRATVLTKPFKRATFLSEVDGHVSISFFERMLANSSPVLF